MTSVQVFTDLIVYEDMGRLGDEVNADTLTYGTDLQNSNFGI